MNIRLIRKLLRTKQYSISKHAYEEAFADGLDAKDILHALRRGKIIEAYPMRHRCLVLGFTAAGAPVHVVCDVEMAGHMRIVTVYVPTPDQWVEFKLRKG